MERGRHGPKRDVLGELKEEAKKRGIHFCTSSHRAEHWFFLGNGKTFDSDIHEPLKKGDFYWPSMPEADPGGPVFQTVSDRRVSR